MNAAQWIALWVVVSLVVSPFIGRFMGFNDYRPVRNTIPPRP